MSKFAEFRQQAEIAIENILQAIVDQGQSHPGEDLQPCIEEQIDQHITPISGTLASETFGILHDKPDWRKNTLELVLRRRLLQIVDLLPESNPELFNKLFELLDVILTLQEKDYLEQIIPLTFIEELMDVHTITSCERLFDYVESRKTRLIVNMIPGRGKALVLLRTCNEMLRRLSKETNTVFCGRILMFLANSFPLGERSGVNLRGDFNSEPIHYDSDEMVDNDETMTDDQKTFYKIFWSTRKYFSDPPTVLQADNFIELQKGAQIIFEKFGEIAKNEEEVSGAKSLQVAGFKRKSMTIHTDDNDTAEAILKEINNDYRFPRLLTNRKLLELEIEDVRFRRNVILQFLILFQYISAFSQDEKENTRSLLAARGANKQTLVQPTYTVTNEQIEWMTDMESKLIDLLRHTKPHGNLYTDIVLIVLKHERNWIIWKASGCPPFEKPPLDSSILEQARQQRKKILKTTPSNYRFSYGNMEMSNMYGKPRETLATIMQSRQSTPSPVNIIDQSLKILDREKDATVEERYNIANGALFQVTRLMFRTHASLIPKVYDMKRTYFNELVSPGSSASSMSSSTPPIKPLKTSSTTVNSSGILSESGDAITEKHVEMEVKVLKEVKKLIVEEGLVERKQIVVTNQCQPDLQVNQLSNNNNTAFNNTTVVVASQTSYIFTVSPTWSGRIWGQPVCEDDICSHSPVSLAEFTMNTHDHDFYDISFVDGFNLPMTIAPRSIMETNNTNQCQRVGCGQLPKCPNDLIQSQGCQSACSRYHQDEYCCMGDYNTPDTCVTNHYAEAVKKVCGQVYTFPFDDATSTYYCNDDVYDVVFCPT
ncbi:THO complex subunit 1 transcription elongation factor-domain-containing protein [Halteromyces radiatus]|uniref:THO complex subunit 1 transcription elongation factor-domain-containing protein n=1 Tax=Halteromyces radiatus TaxID=101107 RepID=UPI00221EE4D3|nr:THO complex subunit 1 transcription elongation factor-domain-containing protein [Halteromyces radiatus]KAI8092828.1 THO complex subunit 1 transcription elongation factor-domain-containing protein [Halteromyces radiatus]